MPLNETTSYLVFIKLKFSYYFFSYTIFLKIQLEKMSDINPAGPAGHDPLAPSSATGQGTDTKNESANIAADGESAPYHSKVIATRLAFKLTETAQTILNTANAIDGDLTHIFNRKSVSNVDKNSQKQFQNEFKMSIPQLVKIMTQTAKDIDLLGRLNMDLIEHPMSLQVDSTIIGNEEVDMAQLLEEVEKEVQTDDSDINAGIGMNLRGDRPDQASVFDQSIVQKSYKDPNLPQILNGVASLAMSRYTQKIRELITGPNSNLNSNSRWIISISEHWMEFIRALTSAAERLRAMSYLEGTISSFMEEASTRMKVFSKYLSSLKLFYENLVTRYGLLPSVSSELLQDIQSAASSGTGARGNQGFVSRLPGPISGEVANVLQRDADTKNAMNAPKGPTSDLDTDKTDHGIDQSMDPDERNMRTLFPRSARGSFFTAGRDTVAQDTDSALLQEMLFNTFGFVEPNGYLGPNKIHQDNKRNQRMQFQEPLAFPRTYEPMQGIREPIELLVNQLPLDKLSQFFSNAAKKASNMSKLMKRKRQESTALIDDTNVQASSRGLYWSKPSFTHFPVQTEFRPIPTKDPAGVELNKRGFKHHKLNTWWNPFVPQTKQRHVDPTPQTKFQRLNRYYDAMM